jgi:predicted RNA-binding Zn-ribbon protein involved in translation (DUF1610 family)
MHVAAANSGKGFTGDRLEPAGKLSAYTCPSCGYTELYVDDPATIRVDGKHVRETVAR